MNRIILICLISICLLSACGGGGGGGSSSPPAPVSQAPDDDSTTEEPKEEGFSAPFLPFQNFEQMCENPRSGFDSRGSAFPDLQGTTADENNWIRAWSHELYLWYNEILDVDPESLPTDDYFDQMKTFQTTPSGEP